MPKPNLIIQAQRMGDLILSFPLMLWMLHQDPQNELWVAGEQTFSEPLLPVSPPVTYFPLQAGDKLKRASYNTVVNLRHRPEAAALAGSLSAGRVYGRLYDKNDSLRVQGFWQLYRAGLVDNNRYNPFHWADLNGLDVVKSSARTSVRWPQPGARTEASNKRIGVFVGASQKEKLPLESFWADLCRELLKRKFQPVLLGGPAERKRGARLHDTLGGKVPDLCGHLNLRELAEFLRNCALLVTPDTGPMHLAAWLGTRVLNLSVGPVNPWETGPYQPGHMVLAPSMSCSGCWTCGGRGHRCRGKMQPLDVAYAIHRLLGSGHIGQAPRGLKGWTISRDDLQLFELIPFAAKSSPTSREALRDFWKAFWLFHGGLGTDDQVRLSWHHLIENYPAVHDLFKKAGARLVSTYKKQKRDATFLALSCEWANVPVFLRPLSGFLQFVLQNQDFSPAAYRQVFSMIEHLLGVTD